MDFYLATVPNLCVIFIVEDFMKGLKIDQTVLIFFTCSFQQHVTRQLDIMKWNTSRKQHQNGLKNEVCRAPIDLQ